MTTNGHYQPTESEKEQLLQGALTAAYRALEPLSDEKAGLSSWVRACLNAFKEAQRALADGEKALLIEHPGARYCLVYHELELIVASAVWGISTGAEPSIVHPYSQSGHRILALLHAGRILDGIDHIRYIFEMATTEPGEQLGKSIERLIETALREPEVNVKDA